MNSDKTFKTTMSKRDSVVYHPQEAAMNHSTEESNPSSKWLDDLIQKMEVLNFGTYRREQHISNLSSNSVGQELFNVGLRLMMSFQHELAAQYFMACLQLCPYAVLAHGLIALCHGPNYNFKGALYYGYSNRIEDEHKEDILCQFPSQHVANRNSAAALAKIGEIQMLHADEKKYEFEGNCCYNEPAMISDVEIQLLSAIRLLTSKPGIDAERSDEKLCRPYANAMRTVYQNYPDDPDVTYIFVESLMVLNAWQLYEYPSGKVLSPDVDEIRAVLERSLLLHPYHPGLMHMYIHLSEMSPHPELAVPICEPFRNPDQLLLPHAGHLIHMPSHLDVLLGEYDKCIQSNLDAIEADLFMMKCSPETSGPFSLFFGYIAHDFHMAIYGAILGGMEQKGMELAAQLNTLVNETFLKECPPLVGYLESYSASDIHVMVRFGRWTDLLQLEMPTDENLMLFRSASVTYGRALAYTMKGNFEEAKKEADKFDVLRMGHPEADERILHTNSVGAILAVDAVMVRGEIAYREGKHAEGLEMLRKAVEMQDNLNYDEPWGKMQPIRHALGGLLLENGKFKEAEDVFRKDLSLHPRNPWALVGLIGCLERKQSESCCCCGDPCNDSSEILTLKDQLCLQRQMKWADFNIVVPCECCVHPVG